MGHSHFAVSKIGVSGFFPSLVEVKWILQLSSLIAGQVVTSRERSAELRVSDVVETILMSKDGVTVAGLEK